jgi:quinolinate synthase
MADMANMEQVNQAWDFIKQNVDGEIRPVTYMNSTADLKAFCGERKGIVCTSSNAAAIFDWAFGENKERRIFFFPDEHLGRNTGKKMGLKADEMVVWDPHLPQGGTTREALIRSKVILWKGHCPVHMEFKARDIKQVRNLYPDCKVIVHPECEKDVVDAADAAGSTDQISRYVAAAPSGSIIFVGTEVNLVTRLQSEFPDKKIFKLQRSLCLTMYQITLANLCFTLEHLGELEAVVLPDGVKKEARVALSRMIESTKNTLAKAH